MKTLFLSTIFLTNSFILFSQDYVDLLKINASTTPFNNFDTSSAQSKLNEINADLTFPIKVNEKLTIISGLIYETIQTKLFEDEKEKTFGSTTLKLGFNNQFNEKWSLTTVFLPKISSDYKAIQTKDFQVGAIAFMKFKKRNNLNYKFGVYYNSELFGPIFVPMFGLYYLSPNKKFEANLMLPLQADLNYKLIPSINVGVNFLGQIRSYHLTNIKPEYHSTYMARSTNELYGYLKFNFSKSISLITKCGISVGRNYRVYDEDDRIDFALPATFIGGNRKQLNTDFSNGLIFQVSFLYRFNLNK